MLGSLPLLRRALLRGRAPLPRHFSAPAPPVPTPPKSLGSRALEYAFDHPWRALSPFAATLLVYLVRSSIATSNQDALVRGLDEAAPLHLREAAAVGKATASAAISATAPRPPAPRPVRIRATRVSR